MLDLPINLLQTAVRGRVRRGSQYGNSRERVVWNQELEERNQLGLEGMGVDGEVKEGR